MHIYLTAMNSKQDGKGGKKEKKRKRILRSSLLDNASKEWHLTVSTATNRCHLYEQDVWEDALPSRM